MSDIRQRVVSTIVHELGVSSFDITDDSTVRSLRGDSLDEVEVMMELEKEFQCDITDQAWYGTELGMYDRGGFKPVRHPNVAEMVEIVTKAGAV